MSSVRCPGPLRETGQVTDPFGQCERGPLQARILLGRGSNGTRLESADLRSETLSNVLSQFRRLTGNLDGDKLQEIAVALLGPSAFSVGVVAGIGADLLSIAAGLAKLCTTLVLADLYDLGTSRETTVGHYTPFGAPRHALAKLAVEFFGVLLREAADERDALIREVREAMRSPGDFFEGLAEDVVEGYQRDWKQFQASLNTPTLEGRYRAGVIFGRTLVDFSALVAGGMGAAKLAAKAPRLLKVAKSAKVKLRRGLSKPPSIQNPTVLKDYVVRSGGRSGPGLKTMTGPPHSAFRTTGGHVVVTNDKGQVVLDISRGGVGGKPRVKTMLPNKGWAKDPQGHPLKSYPTPEQFKLLDIFGL